MINLYKMTLIQTVFLLLVFHSSYGMEELYISKGIQQLTPIAINDFATPDISEKRMGENILEVIKSDLRYCGIFKLVSPEAFIETKRGVQHKPDFASWRQINANLLLNGQLKREGAKQFVTRMILWDNITGRKVLSIGFKGSIDSWRRFAHQVSDKIYEAITGDKGYFDTKIYYIAEREKGLNKFKRIAVMDYDGSNHEFLSDDKVINLTPRLSPSGKNLLYVSYLQGKPKVFSRSLKTGKSTLLITDTGMSFAPRFAPDESKIIYSLARHGATHLWEMSLRNFKTKQLTTGFNINTSPTYSPDGKFIYFNSDRSGSKQLYSMKPDGSQVRRISFGDGSYSTPVISPNGKYVAFIKSIRGENFYLGVMDIDGSNERLVVNSYLVDSISWAPNSRVISFAKTSRVGAKKKPITKIHTIDIEGLNEREILTPFDGTDPEWSVY